MNHYFSLFSLTVSTENLAKALLLVFWRPWTFVRQRKYSGHVRHIERTQKLTPYLASNWACSTDVWLAWSAVPPFIVWSQIEATNIESVYYWPEIHNRVSEGFLVSHLEMHGLWYILSYWMFWILENKKEMMSSSNFTDCHLLNHYKIMHFLAWK